MPDVTFGLDLGGTSLKFGIIDSCGCVLADGSVSSRAAEGLKGVKAAFAEAVADLIATAKQHKLKPRAVGIGVPGTVAGPRGKLVTASPNLPFMKNLCVAEHLEKLTKLPTVADNDATLAGFAEAQVGAGAGKETVLTVTVGTGLGGSVQVGGMLIRGRNGTGGEIGHGVFMPDGEPCGCGGRGCLEQYTATRALRRFYAESGGEKDVEIRTLVERAKAGEKRAVATVARVGRNLGLGLATAATLIAPDVIVVGGGLSSLGDLLLKPARAAFMGQVLEYVGKGCRIVRAKLGNHAGMVGAGLLAFEHSLNLQPRLNPPRRRGR